MVDADGIVGFEPLDPELLYIDAAVERPLDSAVRQNLRRIVEQVDTAFTAGDRLRVLEHLTLNGPSTLIETAAATVDTRDPVSAVVAMAARRVIDLDWRSGPISVSSAVSLRPGQVLSSEPEADRTPSIFR